MVLNTEITLDGIKVTDNTGALVAVIRRDSVGEFWFIDGDGVQRIEATGWSVPRNEFQSLDGVKYYLLAMEHEAMATGH